MEEQKFDVIGKKDKVLELVNKLSTQFTKDNITQAGMINVITHTMLLVKTYNNMNGSDKKDLTISVIKHLAEKLLEDDNKIEEAYLLIDAIAPEAIDTIYWVSSQKFKFNKKACCLFKCFH